MIEKKLGDLSILVNDFPHMPYWGSLKEAMVQLSLAHEKGHDTILVFDEAYKLVGTLSQKNILDGLGLGRKAAGEKGSSVSWELLLGEKTEKTLSLPVKKFMSKPKAAISISGEILKACRMMSKKGVTILPVTDGEKIYGIVRIGDAAFAVAARRAAVVVDGHDHGVARHPIAATHDLLHDRGDVGRGVGIILRPRGRVVP